ncbi:MAG: S-methyl-5-thioribose-1-phosphate isomerase, partial [Planctomycetales bacterium]|nr:S-methyl-5-thioribose-1-phosphate isomerase [Planctomycetales bacterium]
MSSPPPTLHWQGDVDGHLVLLDQTRLPGEVVELDCLTVEDIWQAIKRLAVRGAPAIGCAAAYGVCLSLREAVTNRVLPGSTGIETVGAACDYLATSRPTAVNLFWALERMRAVG